MLTYAYSLLQKLLEFAISWPTVFRMFCAFFASFAYSTFELCHKLRIQEKNMPLDQLNQRLCGFHVLSVTRVPQSCRGSHGITDSHRFT